ncbi:MAG: thioredoxin domain-containing protein, partial [Sediminibacterium sp.]|nr:thioredoxin domain-containing protein [Sediminibacterium sp.]
LNLSKQENKPILVSIGYSACHWCHVMERESFEDEATAAFMNANFINIKIDREERPDLDHIYMDAVQAMTGSGGWPLNVFLTPQLKPFYGGTYFPPQRVHNRPSWIEVLTGVSKGYQENNQAIVEQAENLTGHLLKSNSFGMVQPSTAAQELFFSTDSLETIAANILQQADTEDGGFGSAPKFPQTASIIYLLRHYYFTKNEVALEQALLSLNKMIQGGIYDQLGGGFARYSTDAKWLAPHFEKMLYDNALLIMALSEAYQLTGQAQFKVTIEQTIQFIQRELTHENNGFFSALDADSEGVEGRFYTFSKAEIETVLGSDADFYCTYYQVEAAGNWHEGKQENPATNILHINRFATEKELVLLAACNEKMMQYRSKRVRPLLDDKILLGWNALMITALCKAFNAIGDESFKQLAIQNLLFLESNVKDKETGYWCHTYKNGLAKIPAFLDDYAYLIQAYIHLQEITGNAEYLFKAKDLTQWVMDQFTEEATGFFYYTPQFQTDVILRKKEVYDGATPSGNAIMVENLQYLAIVFDLPNWAKLAEDLMASLENAIIKHPTSFAVWGTALQKHVMGFKEIVITGQHASQYLYPLNKQYLPNKIIQAAETNLSDFPLLTGKLFKEDSVLFYLCKNYACGPAFTSVEAVLANV